MYLREHESKQSGARPEAAETTVGHVTCDAGEDHDQKTGSTMSCENAASIIAGMRGHSEDEEVVRMELGCASNRTCKVKNVRVLQVMEME